MCRISRGQIAIEFLVPACGSSGWNFFFSNPWNTDLRTSRPTRTRPRHRRGSTAYKSRGCLTLAWELIVNADAHPVRVQCIGCSLIKSRDLLFLTYSQSYISLLFFFIHLKVKHLLFLRNRKTPPRRFLFLFHQLDPRRRERLWSSSSISLI